MKNFNFRAIKPAAALTLLCLAAFLLSACSGGGAYLTSVSDGNFTYELYGYDTGVRRVSVLPQSGGDEIFSFTVRNSNREPYAENGGDECYGFRLADVNADGHADVIVTVGRISGSERYRLYLGDGNGGFSQVEQVYSLVAPVFGNGDGRITVNSHTREDEPKTVANSPDVYIESETETVWGWNAAGKFAALERTALIYYSENEIYCYVIYAADATAPGGFVPDDETWIFPDRLARYGFEPFPGAAGAEK